MKGNIYYVNVSDMKISQPFKSLFYSEEKDIKTGEYIKWIQELKISPDDSMVAFGSHCGKGKSFSKIQILSITNDINKPFRELMLKVLLLLLLVFMNLIYGILGLAYLVSQFKVYGHQHQQDM